MRVYCRGIGDSKSGRVGLLLGLLLLLFLVLLAQHAIGKFMDSPHHVVFMPMVSIFDDFLHLFFTVFWRLFLPRLILHLFTLVGFVLLVFLLLALVVALLVHMVCNGAELGIQLELALQSVEGGGHCHNFLVVGGFGSPHSFCFEPVKFALCKVMSASWVMVVSLPLRFSLCCWQMYDLNLWQGTTRQASKRMPMGVIYGCALGNQM